MTASTNFKPQLDLILSKKAASRFSFATTSKWPFGMFYFLLVNDGVCVLKTSLSNSSYSSIT